MQQRFVILVALLTLLLGSSNVHAQATWQQTSGPEGGSFSLVYPRLSIGWCEVGGLLYQSPYAFGPPRWYAPFERYLDSMDIDSYVLDDNYNAFLRKGKIYGIHPDTAQPRVNLMPTPIVRNRGRDTLEIRGIYFSRTRLGSFDKIRYFTPKEFYLSGSEIHCSIEAFPRDAQGEYRILQYSGQNHKIHLCCLDSAGVAVWLYGFAPAGLFGDVGEPTTLDSQYIRWKRLDLGVMFPRYPQSFFLLDGDSPGAYNKQALAHAGDTLYTVQFDTLGAYNIIRKVHLPQEEDQDLFTRVGNSNPWWGIGSYFSNDTGKTWTRAILPPRRGKVSIPDYSTLSKNLPFTTVFSSRLGILSLVGRSDTARTSNKGLRYANVKELARSYQAVYAVTEAGDLFTTSDQGQNWTQAYIKELKDSSEDISALGVFADYVFVGTKQGLILRSGDKGKTWIEPLFRTDLPGVTESKPIFSFYTHKDTLFASTSTGLYYSLYYGNVWTKADAGMKGIRYWAEQGRSLYACIPKDNEGGISLNRGLYRSTDAGLTWSKMQVPSNGELEMHSLTATPDYLFLGTNKGLYASKNEGQSWEAHPELFAAADSVIHDLVSVGNNVLAVAGTNIYSFKSSLNRGVVPIRTGLRRRARPQKLLIDFNTVYLATANNSVYKSTDIVLDVEQELRELTNANGILSMHNDGSTLHVYLRQPFHDGSVQLWNVVGAQVAAPNVEHGVSELHLDVSSLSGGIYYVHIREGSGVFTLPFVIAR